MKRYATSTFHSLDYYKGLLLSLLSGLTSRLTNKEIAAKLNREGIRSPVGNTFDAECVKRILKSLRNPEDYPSNAQYAMLMLCFKGELSPAQCLPLTTMRAGVQ